MAFPPSVLVTTVFGTIELADGSGTPAVGSVAFTMPVVLRDSLDNIVLVPKTFTVALDGTGSFTIDLPATDSPDITPSGWTYDIAVNTDVWRETWQAAIPHDPDSLKFADVIRVASSSDGTIFAPRGHTHLVTTPAVTLPWAATLNTDASRANHFRVTLEGDTLLAKPTHLRDSQKIMWELIQDGVGSHTISFDSSFVNSGTVGIPVLSITAGARDFLGAVYNADTDKLYIIALAKGQ